MTLENNQQPWKWWTLILFEDYNFTTYDDEKNLVEEGENWPKI